MKPHLVKMIEDGATRERTLTVPKESYKIKLKQENIDIVKRAMIGVTIEGTSAHVFRNAAYVSAGKTGTAQAVGIKKNEKYDAEKIAERLRDHSLYSTFAPADNPRIALAVIVENAGFGSAAAAPIARIALDYYLLGKRPGDTDKVVAGTSGSAAGISPQPAAAANAAPQGAASPATPVKPVASTVQTTQTIQGTPAAGPERSSQARAQVNPRSTE